MAVLILTAFSQRNLIEEARDAGVAAYLVKPFQSADIVPAIEVALARFTEYCAIEDEHTRLAEDVPSLEDKLETRQVVDRAKAVLMDRHGMSELEAFNFIQRTAMDRRVRMQQVAQEIIDGTLTPEDPSGTGSSPEARPVPSMLAGSVGFRHPTPAMAPFTCSTATRSSFAPSSPFRRTCAPRTARPPMPCTVS